MSREQHFRDVLKEHAPALAQRDLSPILNRMRKIKSAEEIALVNRATRIGGDAIVEAMRSTEPGLAEYELEQIFVRLEDMIVITASGATITSDVVPRSIAAVEKTIAEPGMLQQYRKIK